MPRAARCGPRRTAARSAGQACSTSSAGTAAAHPGGGQLDGQRQPVQPPAERGHRRRRCRSVSANPGRRRRGPLGEQPHRVVAAGGRRPGHRVRRRGHRQRRHRRARPRRARPAAPGWWPAPAAPGSAAQQPVGQLGGARRPGARSCPAAAGHAGRPAASHSVSAQRPAVLRDHAQRPGQGLRRPGPGRDRRPDRPARPRPGTRRPWRPRACSASRVLPTPAGPVSVTSRWPASSASSWLVSASRPTRLVSGAGRAEPPGTSWFSWRPISASAARSATASLRSSAATWLSTVRTETCHRSAISRLRSRSASAARTSVSRPVTPARASRRCAAVASCPVPGSICIRATPGGTDQVGGPFSSARPDRPARWHPARAPSTGPEYVAGSSSALRMHPTRLPLTVVISRSADGARAAGGRSAGGGQRTCCLASRLLAA